jgi:hypothetical protein
VILGDLLLLAAGYGLLRLVARDADLGLLAGVALSWLSGVVALGAVTTYAGVLGLHTTRGTLAVPLVALALSPLRPSGFRWLRPRRPRVPPTATALGWLVGAWATAAATHVRTVHNDEYAIWALRGRALALGGRLDPRIFAAPQAVYQHLDYPLLVPALFSWTTQGGGGERAVHAQGALLLAAMLATIGWAVTRLAGTLAAVAAVLLATVPHLVVIAGRVLGDVPTAAYAVTTVLLLALWLRDEQPWQVRLAAVMSAGAVLGKNEGLPFVLAAAVLAAVAAPGGGRRRVQPLAGFATAVVAYVPWLLWVHAHDLGNDVVNANAGDRAVLSAARLRLIASGMADAWPLPGWWLLLLLVAVALAVRNGAWRAALLTAGTAAAAVLTLAAIYVVTPLEVKGHIHDSAHRVLLFPAVLAAVSIPLLAGLPRVSDAGHKPRTRRGGTKDSA